MDGEKFFQLALRLSASDEPENLRTAISRAYYAAYHKSREVIQSFGVVLPVAAECHAKMNQVLANSGNRDVIVASGQFATLRRVRNSADYDLHAIAAESKRNVITHLRTADEVMTCLDRCCPGGDLADIRDTVRAYAKDVLRLTVT